MGLRQKLLAVTLVATSALIGAATASAFTLGYGGRLTAPNGKPVDGTVELSFKFFAGPTGGPALGSGAIPVPNVKLSEGAFAVEIIIPPGDVDDLFGGTDSPYIEVTDVTNGKTYPRQKYAHVPYALRVPIDGSTLGWDSDGKLKLVKVDGVASGNLVLAGDDDHVTIKAAGNSDAQTLVLPPTDGGPQQVLTTDGNGNLSWTAKASGAGNMDSSTYDVAEDGTIDLAAGGTGADLSLTGGSGQFVKQETAGGGFTVGAIAAGELPGSIDPLKLSPGSVSSTELGHLDGVSSPIQTQLDGKLPAAEKAAASGVASLTAGSKVVQDPANAQTTAAANKIPMTGAGTTLDLGWLPATLTGKSADTIDGIDGASLVQTSRSVTAGTGLTGGGDLSANRTLALDIHGLTAETTNDNADTIALYDDSAGALRKMTRANFLSGYLSTESDPQVGTITNNYVPKWNGSALVTGTVSDVSGKVGIGTASAETKLHVVLDGTTNFLATDVSTWNAIELQNTAAGLDDAVGIIFNPNGQAALGNRGAGIVGIRRHATESRVDLAFLTDAGSSDPLERMRIDEDGNVGIGTPSPTAKLHVAGTAGTDGIKFPDGSLQTTAARTNVNGSVVLGATFSVPSSAWSDSGLDVTLPSAGTYLVIADVRTQTICSGGYLLAKLRNETTSTDVPGANRLLGTCSTADNQESGQIVQVVTTAAANQVIGLHGARLGGTSWTGSQFVSDVNGRTVMTYVKLSD